MYYLHTLFIFCLNTTGKRFEAQLAGRYKISNEFASLDWRDNML